MKKWLAAAALFIPLALAGCSHPQPVYYQPPPPPLPLREISQQGFHDGYEAARHDIAYGRPLALERHELFHHPPVPPPAFAGYRDGFRRGYDTFVNRAWAPRPGY
jgi:hypothetical protein